MLKKAAPVATSTTALPPANFPFDDIPLADLPVPLPSSTMIAKGNGDLLQGVTFTWLIAQLEEQLVGLEEE